MKKLYDEFLFVPKSGKGKVREKVMLVRTAMAVVIMVFCLAAMGISAYAYFTYNIISDSNVIQAANFETKVSIKTNDSAGDEVRVERVDAKTQAAILYEGKEYLVTIEKTGTAKTGFCVISAKNCEVENYHTQQIGKDVKSDTKGKDSISFILKATKTTEVRFYSHWGTSSHYADYEEKGKDDLLYIIDGETVTLEIEKAIILTEIKEEEILPETTGEEAPETTEETPPVTTEEAPPETTEETPPVTTEEAPPETTEETPPVTTEEEPPETTEEVLPETTEEVLPEAINEAEEVSEDTE